MPVIRPLPLALQVGGDGGPECTAAGAGGRLGVWRRRTRPAGLCAQQRLAAWAGARRLRLAFLPPSSSLHPAQKVRHPRGGADQPAAEARLQRASSSCRRCFDRERPKEQAQPSVPLLCTHRLTLLPPSSRPALFRPPPICTSSSMRQSLLTSLRRPTAAPSLAAGCACSMCLLWTSFQRAVSMQCCCAREWPLAWLMSLLTIMLGLLVPPTADRSAWWPSSFLPAACFALNPALPSNLSGLPASLCPRRSRAAAAAGVGARRAAEQALCSASQGELPPLSVGRATPG